jgi:hypothetical protein
MATTVAIFLIIGATLMGISHEDHNRTPPVYTPVFYAGVVFMSLTFLAGGAWLIIGIIGWNRKWFT